MTAVVSRAELAGKKVMPLIVPTNNPLHAVLRTASDLSAQEVVLGASNKYTAEDQIDQVALYWMSIQGGQPAPLTVRIISRNRDLYFDLARREPHSEDQRTPGTDRGGTAGGRRRRRSCAFYSRRHFGGPRPVPGRLDHARPQRTTDHGPRARNSNTAADEADPHYTVDLEQASQLKRDIDLVTLAGEIGPSIVEHAKQGGYDLVVLLDSREDRLVPNGGPESWTDYVVRHAPCFVFTAVTPPIPALTEEE